MRQNVYVHSLYRNSDLDDRIFDCLLASMADGQAEDVRASFLFVGDLNGHHQEWLGSTTTNRHGVAAFDFATVSGCDQLVVGPTHARGGTLELLMTDVPDLVSVAVVAPLGNSVHSSLSAVIPEDFMFQENFPTHTRCTVSGAIRELPWRNIWLSDNPVEVFTEHLSLRLDVMYQPMSFVCVTRINLGLMINAGMLLASRKRITFGGPVIALGLTGNSLSAIK